MKYLIAILLCLCASMAYTQPPFKPGTYLKGDKVTFNGSVYVQQNGCKACKATPENNPYWKQQQPIVPPVPQVPPINQATTDSLQTARLTALENLLKNAIIIHGADTLIVQKLKAPK